MGIAITVLHTEGCPNVEPLLALVGDLVQGRRDASISTVRVRSAEEATALGFHGSPTILIDGRDPFPRSAGPGSLSCRIYPDDADPGGGVRGYPSRDHLVRALGGPEERATS